MNYPIHQSVYDKVRDAIVGAYKQITIGNPLDENNHVGPLIDVDAVNTYLAAIEKAKAEGGTVLVEGGVVQGSGFESGCYVKPAIIEGTELLSGIYFSDKGCQLFWIWSGADGFLKWYFKAMMSFVLQSRHLLYSSR